MDHHKRTDQSRWDLDGCSCVYFLLQGVNQNLRNGGLTEIKGVYLGFVKTVARETQIQEALELCSARLQNGRGL